MHAVAHMLMFQGNNWDDTICFKAHLVFTFDQH